MAHTQEAPARAGDPLWYQNALIYQLHVRAFFDSDDDGIGDFRGLTRKLDYLQDLGVTALWLQPFYPSPLRDDGYDIADYTRVHPSYGKLRDFKRFLREAHERGLRVITELVLNHTSDQHPWFQRARKAPAGSKHREFYVWSDDPSRYRETRIIFKDFEHSNWAWDPVAKSYYWHRFYSHQPDLNFDNPAVHEAMLRVLDHWLEMGVDGLRLDAVPYLYEREGTTCENLPETHAFLRKIRRHVEERFPGRMLLAEANQWPEDAVAYFGSGDECHMAFHFPVMPRLFMAVRMEDRFPVLDILEQTPPIPPTCQWAVFLRNHDELTLEMVTDEERDYMYRVYAEDPRARINLGIRRRLAPLLGNDRRRTELLNGLLFSLPGTPIIYYGDEIGMGDNIFVGDRNGVRTPMQWSPDRNAGFSKANPQRLYLPVIIDPEYHYESVNVEAQQDNPHSLLWWMRRLISLRRRHQAFGRGDIEFLHPENRKVLVFLRTLGEERILVLANLSRFTQYVEPDLSAFEGMVPVELFSGADFPPVTDRPYFFTLGPHAFQWFSLERPRAEIAAESEPRPAAPRPIPISTAEEWSSVFEGRARTALEKSLPDWLRTRRWYGAKDRGLRKVTLSDVLALPGSKGSVLALARVDYSDGDPDTWLLPLACLGGAEAERFLQESPRDAVAVLRPRDEGADLVLCDAAGRPDFAENLLHVLAGRRRLRGEAGDARPSGSAPLRSALQEEGADLAPHLLKTEQSNTSIAFGNRFILKLFRRVEPGINPDLEIGRYLTRLSFPHVPAVAGSLEYHLGEQETATLAVLQEYVPNEGDAWSYTLDSLARTYARMAARPPGERLAPPSRHPLELAGEAPPAEVRALIGVYLHSSELLGRRTAELHLALASATEDPAFTPEPLNAMSQRSTYQSMRSLVSRSLATLRKRLRDLPEEVRDDAQRVVDARDELLERLRSILEEKPGIDRIRNHGDYHLGQVLATGKDFVIIDFEGEPARPLGERRIKRLALRDVAGMLRSFHYAAWVALHREMEHGTFRREEMAERAGWAEGWYGWIAAAFLSGYLEEAGEASFLPRDRARLRILLDALLLEKAVYEVGYELGSRPDWVWVPLRGILELLEDAA